MSLESIAEGEAPPGMPASIPEADQAAWKAAVQMFKASGVATPADMPSEAPAAPGGDERARVAIQHSSVETAKRSLASAGIAASERIKKSDPDVVPPGAILVDIEPSPTGDTESESGLETAAEASAPKAKTRPNGGVSSTVV